MTVILDQLTGPSLGTGLAPPLLSVSGLGRRFGRGCARCLDSTGSEAGTNRCPECGTVVALHDVSLEVGPGEVVGVVGESGSGKTTLLRCLNEQLPAPAAVLVHQNPLAAGLHLRLAAETNVAARLVAGGARRFDEIHQRAGAILDHLEIAPGRHADPLATYSGGMQQRAQLARALVDPPPVLLLDEPTTGLDPSVQAGLLDTIQEVVAAIGGATVLVSHDLGVVAVLASRVVVLHHGRVVEEGISEQVLQDPQHHYSQLLVASRLR